MDEISIIELTNKIFIGQPKDPCYFNIQPANINITNDNHDVIMFPILMSILVRGATQLFGESIMPYNITEYQFDTLKKYIASIGYQIMYNYTYKNQLPFINIWFKKINYITDCKGNKKIL